MCRKVSSYSKKYTNISNMYMYEEAIPPITRYLQDLKLVCNVNIVYRNFKSENSQDYAQKPQRNFTFMNSASVPVHFPNIV